MSLEFSNRRSLKEFCSDIKSQQNYDKELISSFLNEHPELTYNNVQDSLKNNPNLLYESIRVFIDSLDNASDKEEFKELSDLILSDDNSSQRSQIIFGLAELIRYSSDETSNLSKEDIKRLEHVLNYKPSTKYSIENIKTWNNLRRYLLKYFHPDLREL